MTYEVIYFKYIAKQAHVLVLAIQNLQNVLVKSRVKH